MDYKLQILTPGVVSDNQVSRRRGVILHEKTVCDMERQDPNIMLKPERLQEGEGAVLPPYRPSAGLEQVCIPDHLHPYTHKQIEFKAFV